jgi:hypothetical protein
MLCLFVIVSACSASSYILTRKSFTRLVATIFTSVALPISAYASSNSNLLEEMYLVQDYLEYTLRTIDDVSDKKSFEQVDDLLKKFKIQRKIDILIARTPDAFQSCARSRVNPINDELYTIVEYFSISNQEKSRLMVSDSFPGQKKQFLKQGLSAVLSDIRKLTLCYPSEL